MFSSGGGGGGAGAISSTFTRRDSPGHRRRSELKLNMAVHHHYQEPPTLASLSNKALRDLFSRIYWTLRAVQFKMFFKLEEADTNSLNELIKFEPAERPPTLGQLKEFTRGRFSEKWIKYMYAKFKNECPAGRMKLTEFKLLFGPYVPDRMSDAYLERMFNAFCYTSPYADHLTFKDLIECLSTLCNEDAHANAEWTMKLINGQRSDQITLPEFNEFVKSVFLLVGQGEQRRKRMDSIFVSGSKEAKFPPVAPAFDKAVSAIPILAPVVVVDKETLKAVRKRATAVFNELDINGQGYLTLENLEQLFRVREPENVVFP